MSNDVAVKDDFDRLHSFVKENLQTFREVGQALAEIRDRKLYLEGGHTSFRDYCKTEFHHDDRWARRLIDASEAAIEHDVPTEWAARELLKHPKEQRAEIITEAKSRQGEHVTAPMIQDVAWQLANPPSMEGSPRPAVLPFNEITSQIIRVTKAVNELSEHGSAVHLDIGQVRASLKTAFDYVKASVPTHQCYACSGKGCKVCKNLGWIPQAVFDRRPTEFI